MKSLLLTLGHNSSAILVKDGQVVAGYENERLTGIKSDSHFPIEAIEALGYIGGVDNVYVTHWAPSGHLDSMSAKHWHPHRFEDTPIRTLTPEVSHHDTHIAGAQAYAGHNFPYNVGRTIGLVVDGFGTLGEHISIYELTSRSERRLIRRVHGYNTSLGLWYQYATAFMGMKMHEDEYKLLGYEVHVNPDDAHVLDMMAISRAADLLSDMQVSVYGSKFDPAYELNALQNVREAIFSHLHSICIRFNIEDPTKFESRAILAYYVQAVLERTIVGLLQDYPFHHLICSGGVFYNVKLNNVLLKITNGFICVNPLAGDQGNALGLYAIDHPEFEHDEMCIGKRMLYNVGTVDGLYVMNENEAYDYAHSRIRTTGYVNLVRGAMEFGPRALCNTSTLAIPTPGNVGMINKANDRNTVMPMAPAMTMRMYDRYFENIGHVWKSYRHMVIAMDYVHRPMPHLEGVAHGYTRPTQRWTGRPQVVPDTDVRMHALIEDIGHPIINTSFNYHGKPIAYSMSSIIDNHMLQFRRDNTFRTVVIKNA